MVDQGFGEVLCLGVADWSCCEGGEVLHLRRVRLRNLLLVRRDFQTTLAERYSGLTLEFVPFSGPICFGQVWRAQECLLVLWRNHPSQRTSFSCGLLSVVVD